MKYEVRYDSELPFHDRYDENGDIVYKTVAAGDVIESHKEDEKIVFSVIREGQLLEGLEGVFTEPSLIMLKEEGLLHSPRKSQKEK